MSSLSLSHRARCWFAALSTCCGLGIFALQPLAPQIAETLVAAEIRHEAGSAYIVPVAPQLPYPYVVRGAAVGRSASAYLLLYENDSLLGPPDASHDQIRQKGGGAYSHWGGSLYFSSSDGSSPAANGRVYSYRLRAVLDSRMEVVAFGLLLLAFLALVPYFWLFACRLAGSPSPPLRLTLINHPLVERLEELLRRHAKITAATIALASWALLRLLIDTQYLYAFEPDSQGTVDFTVAFFQGAAISGSPRPYEYPPYFDGQFVVYAVGAQIARILGWIGLTDSRGVPSVESLAIFSIRHTNAIAHATAVGIAFLTCLRLSGMALVSLLLALILTLSPHFLAIDMLRVDRVILFAFVLAFQLSLVVASSKRANGTAADAGLALSTALLVMTKVTSAIFLALPFFAYAALSNSGTPIRRRILTFCLWFAAAALVLLVRFIPHELQDPGFTISIALAKIADVSRWDSVFPKTPYLYYSLQQFKPYGWIFLAMATAAGLGIVICSCRTTEFEPRLLLGTLLVLTTIGIVSFKYPRGGYLLAPVYLYCIARGLGIAPILIPAMGNSLRGRWPVTPLLVPAVLLAVAVHNVTTEYRTALNEARNRRISVDARLAARDWLLDRVKPESRIGILLGSEWAIPPLNRTGLRPSSELFEFPYLDPTKLSRFEPPTFAAVEARYDVLVLSDFHSELYPRLMRSHGVSELAARWDEFLQELHHRYHWHRFEGAIAAYGVKYVDVLLIHERKTDVPPRNSTGPR